MSFSLQPFLHLLNIGNCHTPGRNQNIFHRLLLHDHTKISKAVNVPMTDTVIRRPFLKMPGQTLFQVQLDFIRRSK